MSGEAHCDILANWNYGWHNHEYNYVKICAFTFKCNACEFILLISANNLYMRDAFEKVKNVTLIASDCNCQCIANYKNHLFQPSEHINPSRQAHEWLNDERSVYMTLKVIRKVIVRIVQFLNTTYRKINKPTFFLSSLKTRHFTYVYNIASIRNKFSNFTNICRSHPCIFYLDFRQFHEPK